MLILNNVLYSCRPCIITGHGQECTHATSQGGLVSLHESIVVSPTGIKGHPFGRNGGSYRLVTWLPQVKQIIEPNSHKDQEILFSKYLKVDGNKKIGKSIQILDPNSPVLLKPAQEFDILPMGIGRLVHNTKNIGPFCEGRPPIPSDLEPKDASEMIDLTKLDGPVIFRPLKIKDNSTKYIGSEMDTSANNDKPIEDTGSTKTNLHSLTLEHKNVVNSDVLSKKDSSKSHFSRKMRDRSNIDISIETIQRSNFYDFKHGNHKLHNDNDNNFEENHKYHEEKNPDIDESYDESFSIIEDYSFFHEDSSLIGPSKHLVNKLPESINSSCSKQQANFVMEKSRSKHHSKTIKCLDNRVSTTIDEDLLSQIDGFLTIDPTFLIKR
ncbi:hypothetical protein WICMUC_000791 [Wickerhamomyces mucosus]|uniref:Copper-fist domain-containing protein n=1 Tax=Wickerhamomyces mucosus TaxID=1378264 RepID=A0A9P8TI36_9ASCO|nr:hypothetical protein WICMUC_000791 [Wickerhamomyces mucosus]